jgi:hypothetical protein
MNKKLIPVFAVIIILVFIGYMIYDSVKGTGEKESTARDNDVSAPVDAWEIAKEFKVNEGELKAVASSPSGLIYLGGSSFVSCYDADLKLVWTEKTDSAITALSISGDSLFASTSTQIFVLSKSGKVVNEWGPYEDNSIITSVSSNKNYVAFADAGNKMVFILDRGGEVKKIVGQNGEKFIIPSPYFDVALDKENNLFTANTGNHRIEIRTIDGDVKSFFGEAGTAPEYFCGCCAPAHFVKTGSGYITAEKGINRIKILGESGEFVEFVSSKNTFIPSIPLDLASVDGRTIYAANPADSKLYIFKRK